MTTIEAFEYPLFTRGQQLTSTDLNRIPQYVDLQDRLTRLKLIGAGIFNGFGVSWDSTEKHLKIGNGVGVSSKGYLIYQPDDLSFSSYQEINLSEKTLGKTGSQEFKVWKLTNSATDELLHTVFNTPEGAPREEQHKCLLVVWEGLSSKSKAGCFNGLENTSIKVNFQLVYYLVDHTLIDTLSGLPYAPEEAIDFKTLPSPFLPRLGFESPQLDLTQIVDQTTFIQAYTTVCNSGIASICDALVKLEENFSKSLLTSNAFSFKNLKPFLEALLSNCKAGTGYKLPYFYEFLEDLVKAYHELLNLGVVNIPNPTVEVQENWFPFHLLLAGYGKYQTHYRTPKFIAKTNTKPGTEKIDQARFLYLRLQELINAVDLEQLAHGPRIVPSKSYDHVLSARSIPYYYKPQVRSTWNFSLTQQEKTNQIPSYHPLPDTANLPFSDLLLYELESWGFYRIEGHANLPLQDVVAKIEAEQKRLNIAFDIVCIPLSETTQKLRSQVFFPDLEAAFHQLRLEWIIELQLRGNVNDLLQFLETLDGKYLYEVDFKALKQWATGTQNIDDSCKWEVVYYLYSIYTLRTNKPVFKEFASANPGLEHLGGVQPGGTLVLVYDDPITAGQLEKAAETSPVLIADFCLPYLCCAKQSNEVGTSIFACFAPEKLCFNDSPQEMFTWPSGGRLIAQSENRYLPAATGIAQGSQKWNFLPSKLPDDVFNDLGEAKISLSFINLGKKLEVKTVLVSRIKPSFKASAAWAREEPRLIFVQVQEIQPEKSLQNKWISTLMRAGAPVPNSKPIEESTPPSIIELNPEVKDLPSHIQIELIVQNEHGCLASNILTVPIITSIDPIERNVEKKPVTKPSPPAEPVKKNVPEQPQDPGDEPAEVKNLLNPKNSVPANLKKILDQRLNRYKASYATLQDQGKKMGDIEMIRLNHFFTLSAEKTATDIRFLKISESLLDKFPTLEPAEQDRRKQLLEVMIHCFLDQLFKMGHTYFDTSLMPNRATLELHGIDTEAVLKRWKGEELKVDVEINASLESMEPVMH